MVGLIVGKPGREEETILFERPGEVTVGRSSGCTCCLDFDPLVSRMHAVFTVEPPSITIKDLNSTNGILINNEAFGGASEQKLLQPRALTVGDEVMVGRTSFRVVQIDAPPQAGLDYRVVDGSARVVEETGDETLPGLSAGLPSIPGFLLESILGIGQLGCVYLAQQIEPERMVALKILSPEVSYTNKMYDDIKEMVGELRRLKHPNVIRLLGAGTYGPKNLFLVMEYIKGENLSTLLARSPQRRLEPAEAHRFMLQMSDALCYAHGHGYIQDRLNPRNIIVSDAGGEDRVKVSKVGFNRLLDEAGISASFTAQHDADTLAYLAPEKLTDPFDGKPTGDVFSVSAVCYQILTGHIPYDFGDDEEENVAAVSEGRIVSVEERLPGLPEPLVVIIERGLSKDPDDRYPNCCAMLEALQTVPIE